VLEKGIFYGLKAIEKDSIASSKTEIKLTLNRKVVAVSGALFIE